MISAHTARLEGDRCQAEANAWLARSGRTPAERHHAAAQAQLLQQQARAWYAKAANLAGSSR